MVKIKKKCLVIMLLLCLVTSIPCMGNAYSKLKYYDSSYTKTMYTYSSAKLCPSKYCTSSNTTWSTSNSKYATVNKYGTVYTKSYSGKTVYITGIRRSSKSKYIRYRYTYKISIKSSNSIKYTDYSYNKTMYTNSSEKLRPSKYCTSSNTTWSTSNSDYATVNKYGTVYTKGYSDKTVYITGIRRSSKSKNIAYRYTYKIYIKAKDNSQYITKNITMVYNDETGGNMHRTFEDFDTNVFTTPVNYTNSNEDVAYYTDSLELNGMICATDTGKTTIKLTYENIDNNGYVYLTYNINVVYVHNTPEDVQKALEKKLGHSVDVWNDNAYSLSNPIVCMYPYYYEVAGRPVYGYVNSNSLKTYSSHDVDGDLIWFPYGCDGPFDDYDYGDEEYIPNDEGNNVDENTTNDNEDSNVWNCEESVAHINDID